MAFSNQLWLYLDLPVAAQRTSGGNVLLYRHAAGFFGHGVESDIAWYGFVRKL